MVEKEGSSPGFATVVKFKRTIGIFLNGDVWCTSKVSGLRYCLMNRRPVVFVSSPNSLMAS